MFRGKRRRSIARIRTEQTETPWTGRGASTRANTSPGVSRGRTAKGGSRSWSTSLKESVSMRRTTSWCGAMDRSTSPIRCLLLLTSGTWIFTGCTTLHRRARSKRSLEWRRPAPMGLRSRPMERSFTSRIQMNEIFARTIWTGTVRLRTSV